MRDNGEPGSTPPSVEPCHHQTVLLLNEHEMVRKYRCSECELVAACSCDEVFGRRFLAHQLDWATDSDSGLRIPSSGFADSLCNECRGLPVTSAPQADGYRSGGKIQRYYWREIYTEMCWRLDDWCTDNGLVWNATTDEVQERGRAIRKEVIEEIKKAHLIAPKYDTTEPSAADVLAQAEVEVVPMRATYVSGGDRALILHEGTKLYVEDFVAETLTNSGAEVVFCESRPFHALYGILMWMWIQLPGDPEGRAVMFGGRDNIETDEHGMTWTILPSDFGSQGHAVRMAAELDEHLALIPDETDALLWWFDYWRSHSENLCAYLWAHEEEVAATSRVLVEVLGADVIKRILRFLAKGYWNRYLGWPDLLVVEQAGWYFAEVKSSRDRLSGDQKNWIAANYEHLRLPFKLIKVHRSTRVEGVPKDRRAES